MKLAGWRKTTSSYRNSIPLPDQWKTIALAEGMVSLETVMICHHEAPSRAFISLRRHTSAKSAETGSPSINVLCSCASSCCGKLLRDLGR